MTKKKETNPAPSKPIEKKETEPIAFASLCGFGFDPAKAGDCYVVCQVDNPEDFKACLANYESLEVKPKTTSKSVPGGKGKSHWGHINGTQAGLIDDALINAEHPLTLLEIATLANGRLPRVLAHLKYLVTKKEDVVSLTKDNAIFWPENPNMKGMKSVASVTTLFLRKPKKVVEKKEEEKKETPPKKEEGVVAKDAFAGIKTPKKETPKKETTKKETTKKKETVKA